MGLVPATGRASQRFTRVPWDAPRLTQAPRGYLRSDGGWVEVPDEFADSRELFTNLLHNLLLFDELRTNLDIGQEEELHGLE